MAVDLTYFKEVSLMKYYLIGTMALTLLFQGCGSGSSDATDNNTTTPVVSLENGAKLYSACSACHGDQGETSAFGQTAVIADMSVETIREYLAQYRDGTLDQYGNGPLMTGIVSDYSDQNISDVAAYIDTF
jgi:cytochrome c553